MVTCLGLCGRLSARVCFARRDASDAAPATLYEVVAVCLRSPAVSACNFRCSFRGKH